MNLKKIVSIIAIVAIIGFVFFSCEEDPGKTSYGENLKLSGQVYNYLDSGEIDSKALMGAMVSGDWKTVEKTINDHMFPKTEKFEGSLDIEEKGGNSGKITSGSFSFEMGAPDSDYLDDIQYYLDEMKEDGYTNVDADNKSVQIYQLGGFGVKNPNKYYYLGRGNSSGSKVTIDKGSVSSNINYDVVVYIYVTDKVKITAKGFTDKEDGINFTFKDINLSLKKGWNVVKTTGKIETKGGSLSAGGEPSMSSAMGTGTGTVSQSLGDADTKWILDFSPYGSGFGNNGEEENEYE